MVRKVMVSTALAVALAMVYFSSALASEEKDTARVVPIQHCPKPGLCPYIKRVVPEFFYHPTVYAHSPAAPHYPPLHPYYHVPHVSHHHSGYPPTIVVPAVPHHGPAHPPAHGSGDVHEHAPPHHAQRRDAPAPPPAHHHGPHHVEASLCGNLCINDHACPGEKKCCPTECGYSCFDPVHLAD